MLYTLLGLHYTLRLWAPISALRTIFAVAELVIVVCLEIPVPDDEDDVDDDEIEQCDNAPFQGDTNRDLNSK